MTSKIYSLWQEYDDQTLEPIKLKLGPGEKLCVPVPHDEVIFWPNELRRCMWTKKGQMPLWKKGPGWAIYNSGFIVEQIGHLALSPEQIAEQEKVPESKQLPCYDPQEIIYPGKNGDGWWNCDKLVDQVWIQVIASISLTQYAGKECHTFVWVHVPKQSGQIHIWSVICSWCICTRCTECKGDECKPRWKVAQNASNNHSQWCT